MLSKKSPKWWTKCKVEGLVSFLVKSLHGNLMPPACRCGLVIRSSYTVGESGGLSGIGSAVRRSTIRRCIHRSVQTDIARTAPRTAPRHKSNLASTVSVAIATAAVISFFVRLLFVVDNLLRSRGH